MHCSINVGKDGNSALFFGLSGTGKTTLSADPERNLVGDDEHGWTENSVFNFEGGCYAKCVSLTEAREPQIFKAIKTGTLLENTCFKEGTNEVDYESIKKTENTRAAYPLHFINNAIIPSVAGSPKHIFFLTADAFGVLPPIAHLTIPQAIYHFLSGYTAKVAGTEDGILEPQATFSSCFGNAFLTLRPTIYSEMLEKRLKKNKLRVWLINTGWTGGGYGVGKRIPLDQTRAMVKAILNDSIQKTAYTRSPLFGFEVPNKIDGVNPDYLLSGYGWNDPASFTSQLENLASLFTKNFEPFEAFVGADVLNAAPKLKS
jgi:phosphoenolpyruvate carboxykinase (ATP)